MSNTYFSVTYISVLVGCDCNELRLWKREALSLHFTVQVLHSLLRHLHNVQPWLILMQRLQHDHLQTDTGKMIKTPLHYLCLKMLLDSLIDRWSQEIQEN